jgi:hypothetical protein
VLPSFETSNEVISDDTGFYSTCLAAFFYLLFFFPLVFCDLLVIEVSNSHSSKDSISMKNLSLVA